MYTSGSQEEPPPNSQVIRGYLQVLLRRKWLILICLMGVVIPVGLFTIFSTPVYEAEASIIHGKPKDTMFTLGVEQPRYQQSALINLTEQLKSRSLAEEVVRTLPKQIIQTFKLPEPLPLNFSREKFIGLQLQEGLRVDMVRGSDILKIKVQANDPYAVKFIANTYVERIIDRNLRMNRQEVSNLRDLVEKQLAVFQNKLNDSEEALRHLKEKNIMISLSEASAEILRGLTEAEVSYNKVQTERGAMEQRRRSVEKKIQELGPSLNIASNHYAQQLKQQLLELQMQYSSNQVKGLSENNPEMLSLNQKIIQVKQELVQELLKTAQRESLINPVSQVRNLLQESITLEVDLETFKARERGLKKIIAHYEADLQKIPNQETQLARLIRARDVNERIYSMLLEKREEVRITEAGKVGDVQVIDYADEPIRPIKPNKRKNMAVGLFLGLAIGVGLAFFLESIDTSLKSEQDVEKFLNLPVLASIPTINSKRANGILPIMKKNQNTTEAYSGKLFFNIKPGSHIHEAYRALQINFSWVKTENDLKTILVTSAGMAEGKTLTAVNLAQAFAMSGVRTLLIDCDLRRPMIHKLFGINKEPGLSNVLLLDSHESINNVLIDKVVKKLEHQSLSIVPSGTLQPDPSQILMSQKMRDLLAIVKNQYDLIILDSPPLIAVTDSIMLGTEVDGVCMVIKSGETHKEAALKAKQLLESSRARIIGTILNEIDLNGVYGYYKYFYYYTGEKNKKI